MKHRSNLLAFGVGLFALPLAQSASAQLVTYSGGDLVTTTTSAHPNSTAAAASFDAAVAGIGGATTVNFEGVPTGSFSSLLIAPGVTVTGTNSNGANQSILNASNSPSFPTLDGYNTTSGGANFIEVKAGTVTFSFASPVDAFGAYFSGVQTYFYPDNITFSDGTSQTLYIPGVGTSGSVGALSFLGFTDVGKSISSITLTASGNNGADYIGIDDVRFAAAPMAGAVPEPATWAMMLVGFGAIGVSMRYRRRSTKALLA